MEVLSMNLEAIWKYQEAKDGFQRTLHIHAEVEGEGNTLVTKSLNHLVRVLVMFGNFGEEE